MKKRFPHIVGCLLFLAVTGLVSLAFAQTAPVPSRITTRIDDAVRTTIPNSTYPAVKLARDLGPVSASHAMNGMILVLKPSPEEQVSLNKLLDGQQNKNSANYHKWLSPEEFAQRFGPSDEDTAKVTAWLQQQGFQVTSVGRGRQWVQFSGTASQVDNAFRTSIDKFQYNGEQHIGNTNNISLPSALAPVVAGVLSLHDFRKQPTSLKPVTVKRNDDGKLMPVNPTWTTRDSNLNPYYYLAPTDVQKIYDASSLLKGGVDGTGVSIAIAGRSDIYLSDIQSFRQIFGLKRNDPNFIVNGTDPGYIYGDIGESTLDVEWASALAPGATINFVTSASTDTTDGIDLSSAYIVDNALSPIMSLSYSLCEPLMGPAGNQFYNSLWAQAAAEGITVFVSTGDQGAAECDGDLQRAGVDPQGPAQYGPTINGLSSTPYNVAVGGTQYNEGGNYGQYWSPNNDSTLGSVLGYIPEGAWSESCDPTLPITATNCAYQDPNWLSYSLVGGGGGPSNCSQSTVDAQGNVTCIGGYPKPSWQSGLGVPNDGVRDTPDLSLNASADDDGYLLCLQSGCQTTTLNGETVLTNASIVGGTSVATPVMAGIMALIEQKNGVSQGQANYIFYKLAAMDDRAACDSSKRTDPTQANSCNFNDITMGSNSVPGLTGYGTSSAEWTAAAGYDMATGLGTVNAESLATNWKNVTFQASSTSLTLSGGTVAHGQPLNITVSVTSSAGGSSKPSGDVALMTDKYGVVGHVTLDATGSFTGPVANLPGGSYTLTAQYGGDGIFNSSTSAPIAVTVTPENSTTTIQLYMQDQTTYQTVPYTGTAQYAVPFYIAVTVAGKSGQGHPTGTVNILNGGTVVTSAPLNSDGTAIVQTGNQTSYTFPTGASNLSVQYLGDDGFNGSTSAVTPVTFTKQQVTSMVGISWWNVPAGEPVFFTGTIRAFGEPVPTGTLQFYDNGTPLSDPLPIKDEGGYSAVTYTAKIKTPGNHTITAAYSGDDNYTAVAADDPNYAWSSQFQVSPKSGAATTTSVVQSPAAVSFGQFVNYIVTVKPVTPGGPVPTGQVTINSNNQIFGMANLVNGQATISEQAGAQTAQVYAQYDGDSNYAASTSPIFTTTIAKLASTVSLTTPNNYVLAGQQTSLNFVVNGYVYDRNSSYAPMGTVQFFSAVNGGAAQAVTGPMLLAGQNPWSNSGFSARVVLPTGTNVVTAQYSGDSYFNPATTAPVTILVSPPDFVMTGNSQSMTISSGGSSTASFNIAEILGFTGPTSMTCGSGLPSGTSCSFSPNVVPTGGGQTTLTLTMQGPFTTQAKAASPRQTWWGFSAVFGILGFAMLGVPSKRHKAAVSMLMLVCVVTFLFGCGGGSFNKPTTLQLTSSSDKVASGSAVTFTAQLVGATDATGTVTFYDGTTQVGSPVQLTSGAAHVQISTLGVGTHAITAKYAGDKHYQGSTSTVMYQAITGTTKLQVVATSGTVTHTTNLDVTVQ